MGKVFPVVQADSGRRTQPRRSLSGNVLPALTTRERHRQTIAKSRRLGCRDGRVLHTFDSAEQFAPNQIQFRNSTQFVTAGRLLELWSLEDGELVGRGNRLQLIDDSVISIELTHDGNRAFLGCGNGECEVWDLVTLRQLTSLRHPTLFNRRFQALRWHSSGHLLSGSNASVLEWNGEVNPP